MKICDLFLVGHLCGEYLSRSLGIESGTCNGYAGIKLLYGIKFAEILVVYCNGTRIFRPS